MLTKQEIEARLHPLAEQYGNWTFDIPLPYGLWTRNNLNLPHTRLKRVLQVAYDLLPKPLNTCRVLDLGCLDGIFSIEFALQGASVVGVEAREANIKKALFVAEVLELKNLNFIQDDARNISVEKYGYFDIILCSGLLYHLNTPDVFVFIEKMHEMVEHLVIIDTHISLQPNTLVSYNSREYRGHNWREHQEEEEEEIKLKRLWSSYGNNLSFWFTRPSLINFLGHTGFSSIYECFNPPHLNFGRPGLEHQDRCTFIAVKGKKLKLLTSPAANTLEEDWPEESLKY